jgi:hypothetical protein
MSLKDEEKKRLFDSDIFKTSLGGLSFTTESAVFGADASSQAQNDGSNVNTNESSEYGSDVAGLYGRIKELLESALPPKQMVPIEVLAPVLATKKTFAAIEQVLKDKNPETVNTVVGLAVENYQKDKELSEKDKKLSEKEKLVISKDASIMLTELPKTPGHRPDQIDGLMTAFLSHPSPTIIIDDKRDQWKYAQTNDQSYETLQQSTALYSTRTATSNIDGDGVRFMMFQNGTTKVECVRFGFMNNPLASAEDPSSVKGDPMEIDSAFVKSLKLPTAWESKLPIHAKRLQVVQHVLSRLGSASRNETHAQALFQHFLAELVESLHDDDSLRVVNVDTPAANMRVVVEICNEYLRKQGKRENADGTGRETLLVIRSDLVVTNVPETESKKRQLVGCLYNIQMKAAMDKLKNSAVPAKSQLIGESLARSLELVKADPTQRVFKNDVILSALCDCFCMHILVHFPSEGKAYLSHREVEPGRMVCVLAWLHMMSQRTEDVNSTQFEAGGFVIGEAYEDEIIGAIKKRGLNDCQDGKTDPKSNDAQSGSGNARKRNAAAWDQGAVECMDASAVERMELEQEHAEAMSTFTAFQNFYRYGDQLPATEGVMRTLENQNRLGDETHYDRLARAGLGISRTNGV